MHEVGIGTDRNALSLSLFLSRASGCSSGSGSVGSIGSDILLDDDLERMSLRDPKALRIERDERMLVRLRIEVG